MKKERLKILSDKLAIVYNRYTYLVEIFDNRKTRGHSIGLLNKDLMI